MNTDVVTAVSDRATDALDVLFNTDVGRRYLVERQGVDAGLVAELGNLGLSSICNMLASIKLAKRLGLGPDDMIVTVATDGAAMYASERDKTLAAVFADGFDEAAAGETFARHLAAVTTDHLLELSGIDRERIFNLGYFTWVEQQGIALDDFDARRDQAFWRSLRDLIPRWDALIDEFNAQTGAADA